MITDYPKNLIYFDPIADTASHTTERTMRRHLRDIARFYIDGFREMTVGRTLWAIILVKLFILFAVLKLFFFRDPLAGTDRPVHVLEQLTPTDR